MPTYDYRCRSCGHEFEKFKKMSEEAHADCPRCGGQAERLISGGAGLVFKGSGFYITDYRSDSYKKAAKEEKKPAAGGASGEGASSSGGDPSGGKRSESKKGSE
jgi:putative FmdB family regulatory protein